jgi:hypothetical protein
MRWCCDDETTFEGCPRHYSFRRVRGYLNLGSLLVVGWHANRVFREMNDPTPPPSHEAPFDFRVVVIELSTCQQVFVTHKGPAAAMHTAI